LDVIWDDDQGWLHLGPLVTHNDCVVSVAVRGQAWPLAQACWQVGAPQIRNRGTLAGNLVTASPANDTITPLMALEAVLTLRSLRSERRVPLAEFYTGVRRTVMAPDEMITDIAFPALQAGDHGQFLKLALRRAQAISVVNVAVIVRGAGDDEAGTNADPGVIRAARIALGAVAPTILRATEAEAHLVGRSLSDATIDEAVRLAEAAARPISDIRGSAEYRRAMVGTLVRRALRGFREPRHGDGLPDQPVTLRVPVSPDAALDSWQSDADPIATTINGQTHMVRGARHKSLLRMLREDCALPGTKEGCAEGECGACTVILDGQAVMSCLVPAPRAHGAEIKTVEGLAQDGQLHPVQQACVDEGAVQCGYCTPGILMSAYQLLEERRAPEADDIREALTGNLCRCTGYYKILAAIRKAAHDPARGVEP
jgi:carbon-monoxide dehydrogenase medium subunit